VRLYAPFIAGLLVSCSVGPTVIRPDGTKIMLGAALLERTTDESATVTLSDGTQLAFAKKGKDQTVVAKEGIRAWASVASIEATADGLNDGEAIREKGMTARQVSTDSVKKADIAGDVTKATFIPPQ
jgi:hypothetical protein